MGCRSGRFWENWEVQLATGKGHLCGLTSSNGFTQKQSVYRLSQQRVRPIQLGLNLFLPFHNVRVIGIFGHNRLLELQESGLIDYWDLWFRPMSGPCMKNGKGSGFKSQGRNKHPPLSLKNLTGAFLVLSIGISLALWAFLCEKIISMPGRRQRLCQRM